MREKPFEHADVRKFQSEKDVACSLEGGEISLVKIRRKYQNGVANFTGRNMIIGETQASE